MPISLFDVPIPTVDRDTVTYQSTLNVSGTPGGGGQSTFSFSCTLDSNSPIKPRTGNIITWVRDDGTNIQQFAGPIVKMDFQPVGFNETGLNVYNYQITCRDLSYLLEKIVVPGGRYNQKEKTTIQTVNGQRQFGNPLTNFTITTITQVINFPNYLGQSYKEFIEIIAQTGDIRIQLDRFNEDSNMLLAQDYELSSMSFRQAMDQLAIESGLIWWIDGKFILHIRRLESLVANVASSEFTIRESSKNYYGLDFSEDFENLQSRVHVIGNFHDAGFLNPQNQLDGIQRTEEIGVVVTNEAAFHEIRRRMFPNLNREAPKIARLGGPFQVSANLNQPVPVMLPASTIPGAFTYNRASAGGILANALEGAPGIFTTQINAPHAYFESEQDAVNFLVDVGRQYLEFHSRPTLMGSVFYNSGIPDLGQSVSIKLDQLGIEQISPIAEVEITSTGEHQGNDEDGNRIYTYKIGFQDYGFHLRFSRQFYANQYIQIRKPRNIKPSPPEIENIFYSKNSGLHVISLRLKMPNRNPSEDAFGNPQPTTPPIMIGQVELRISTNTLAQTQPENPEVYWSKYSSQVEANNVHLESLGLFNEFSNDYVGETHSWKIFAVPNHSTGTPLYYQVRTVSLAGVYSDWTPIAQIMLSQSKDGNGNDAPIPPGGDEGIDQMQPDPDCCPMVPVTPPPPPPCSPAHPDFIFFEALQTLRVDLCGECNTLTLDDLPSEALDEATDQLGSIDSSKILRCLRSVTGDVLSREWDQPGSISASCDLIEVESECSAWLNFGLSGTCNYNQPLSGTYNPSTCENTGDVTFYKRVFNSAGIDYVTIYAGLTYTNTGDCESP